MTTEIHAHNVLNLLSEKPLTREALTQELAQMYGTEARVHTCKLNGLDLAGLLKFSMASCAPIASVCVITNLE